MATAAPRIEVGSALRQWRERRRLTQMELALEAGVSTRHLSFVETGRSRPGRELMLRIFDQLALPFRERNRLLIAAGHAPALPERSFADPELAPVRDALQLILDGHEPYPAIAVDRHWNLVAANAPVVRMAAALDIDPALVEPPVNAVRASLHPRGLAPLVVNVEGWRRFFRERLERQHALTGDDALLPLIDEVAAFEAPAERDEFDPAANGPLGPLRLRLPGGGELSFFGMFAIFDTPFEVTMSELAVELLFPADRATAEALEAAAG
jgi:transcriptional regulator with XRE-family HTH domain